MKNFLIFLLLLFFSCKSPNDSAKPKVKEPQKQEFRFRALNKPTPFVRSINSFGLNLYKSLAASDTGNLVLSPLSAYSLLAIYTLGAAGQTREELAHAIQCGINPDLLLDSLSRILATHKNDSVGEYFSDFVSATAVWKNKGISLTKSFEKTAKQNDIELKKIDFDDKKDAERAIDNWASEHTKGKIPDIVDPSDLKGSPILFAITNAVSAEAEWAVKFEKGKTAPRDFILANGTVTQALTMQKSESESPYWSYGDFDNFSAIAMRATDSRLTVHVFLPDSGLPIQQFESFLNSNNWEQWQDSILPRKQEMKVFLPKFSFKENIDLIPAVKSFGVGLAFGGGDFSNILSSLHPIEPFITILKHSAVITLEEDGFEAHAVSLGIAASKMYRGEPILFNANHPFFFTITHNETGLILFCGRVMQPVLED